MNWSDYFNYKDGNLIWKVDKGKRIKAGTVAGTLTPKGYVSVILDGKRHQAHNVIWEMLRGSIPIGLEVDHKDGIRNNNKISNMHLVTRTRNNMNRGRRSDNTSGASGVWFNKRSNKWIASAKVSGKVTHLGSFTDFADAVAAREAHNKIAGFSTRHGK